MIAALAREAAFLVAGAWCGVALLALAPLWGLAALRKGSAKPAALPVKWVGPAGGKKLLFVHGWPDDEALFAAQIRTLAGEGYRCGCLTLPGCHDAPARQPHDWWGLSFADVAASLALTIQDAGPVTLVTHDWGAVYGFGVEAAYPQLIERMIACDIGPTWPVTGDGQPPTPAQAFWFASFLGCAYQWMLMLGFVLGRTPSAALRVVGTELVRLQMWRCGRPRRKTSDCAFPYFWFQVE